MSLKPWKYRNLTKFGKIRGYFPAFSDFGDHIFGHYIRNFEYSRAGTILKTAHIYYLSFETNFIAIS